MAQFCPAEKNGMVDRVSLEEMNKDQATEMFLRDIDNILQSDLQLAQEFSGIEDDIIK